MTSITIGSTTFANATVEEVVGVPEPGSYGVLGVGLLGVAGALYRRRSSAQ
ncbi:PEP-CTERM sorting domain-containing protein [Aquisalimonas sp.]|uniref:PEP-CTERM sorting domain-containing protein n=1 Tax=Aquisalimonas sp. TaxID=1872621 RepID=UPI003453FA5F